MEGKNHNESKTKKKIKECKKRLNNLKLQGFTFSKRIYDDINQLERKVKQPTTFNQLWKKKTPISASIFFFLILLILILTLPPPDEPPTLSIKFTNVYDSMKITESFHINGTTSVEGSSSYNIENLNIQYRIDTQSKGDATIISIENNTKLINWRCPFDISTLNDGIHTFSVICYDNKNLSNTQNITLNIEKPRPQVSISSPEDGDIDLNGFLNISGNAAAEFSEIQKVEIIIDNQTEKNVNFNNSNWHYLWNTINVDNGPHTISVRSFDGEKWSRTDTIKFTIFNLENWILPDFQGGQLFQFVIRDIEHSMVPGETYIVYGAHRCKEKHFPPIHSYLEFPNKPEWLSISLENNYLITQRDEKIYYFTFNISITNDAPQNLYGNDFLGWRACYGNFKYQAENCKNILTDDIWIKTGEW